jgi:[acyl-carrier-protein] S-malonyltransferase
VTLALLFPGQGSQYVGMGKALGEAFPAARDTFQEADELLGFSLTRVMWEGPEDELVLTRNAQPAILAHSAAVLRVIRDELGEVAMGAGHSLGEFSAHVAARTFRYGDAVRAVRLRGELMFEAGRIRPGTMAAVLGLDDAAAEAVCREASRGETSVVVPANYNSQGQVVVSGDADAVERAVEEARRAGAKKAVVLSVSGAFHSPLMASAEKGLRNALAAAPFRAPGFPVFSNVTAAPVPDGDSARDLLVRQLISPVRWAASVAAMVEAGADRFLEVGPGSVLTGLNRRNARAIPTDRIGEPEDLERLERLLASGA